MTKRSRIINPAQLEFELSVMLKPTASLLTVSIEKVAALIALDEPVPDDIILAEEAATELQEAADGFDEPVFVSLDEIATPATMDDVWMPPAGFKLPETQADRIKINFDALCLYEEIRDKGSLPTEADKSRLALYTGWGGMSVPYGTNKLPDGRPFTPSEFEAYPQNFRNGIAQIVTRNAPDGAHALFAGCNIPVLPLLFGEKFAKNSRIAFHSFDQLALGISQILMPNARFYDGKFQDATLPDDYFHLSFFASSPERGYARIPEGRGVAASLRLSFCTAPGGLIATNFLDHDLSGHYTQHRERYNQLAELLNFHASLQSTRKYPRVGGNFYSREATQNHEFFLASKRTDVGTEASLFSEASKASKYSAGHWAGWDDAENTILFEETDAIASRVVSLPDTVYSTNYVVPNSLPDFEAQSQPDNVPDIPFGGYKVTPEGVILHNRDGSVRPIRFTNLTEKARLLDLIEIQDTGRKTYALRYEASQKDFQDCQSHLRALCDKYIEDYYALASPSSLQYFVRSSDSGFLLGLSRDYQAAQEGKTDNIFSCEHAPIVDSAKPATLLDAYKRSYRMLGKVNIDHIGELFSVPKADRPKIPIALQGTIFLDIANKQYVPAEVYLSGDVVGKLEEARKAAEFDKSFLTNIQALEKIIPEPLTLEEISLSRCAPWMDLALLRKFSGAVFEEAGLEIDRDFGKWDVKVTNKRLSGQNASSRTDIYATKERSGIQILRMVLKGAPAEFNPNAVEIPVVGGKPLEGKELDAFLKGKREEYALIKEKFKAINASFKTWVEQDPSRINSLQQSYNRALNRYVPYVPPAHSVSLKGMSPSFQPDSHQIAAVAKGANMDAILLNHFTGSGKSFVLAGIANERLMRGQNHKIALVVPRATLTQLAGEISRLFPEMPVHIVGPQDITGETPSVAYQRAVKSSRSLVLFTYETFLDVPSNKSDVISELAKQQKLAERDAAVATIKSKREGATNRAKKFAEEIAKISKQEATMPVDITQAGFDGLMADEAHLLRNLKAQGPGFEAAGGNDRTSDFYEKVQQLRKRTPRLFTAFATGTVGGRKASDIYNLMRYLSPAQLKAAGVHALGDFLNIFAVRDIMTKVDVRGEIRNYYGYELVPSRALANLLNSFTDTVFEDDVPRIVQVRPKYRNEEQQRISVAQCPAQEKIYQEILKAVDKKKGAKMSGDHLLTLYQKSIRAAIDPRLVDPEAAAPANGKIMQSVENAMAIYNGNHQKLGTQLIFCDMYSRHPKDPRDVAKQNFGAQDKTSDEGRKGRERKLAALIEARRIFKADAGFNVYHEYRKELLKRGVPKDEICIVGEVSDTKKDAVYDKFRKGEIRFLLGSRALVGTGMNIQDRIIADHYLDIPWNPEQQWQAAGRMRRPGNQNPIVDSFIYLTEKSPEAIVSSRGEAKIRATSAIFRLTARESSYRQVVGMIGSAAELTAVIRGDDRYMAMSRLDTEISLLRDSIGAAEHGKLLSRRNLMSLQYEYDKSKERMEAQVPLLTVVNAAKASNVLFSHGAFEGGLDGPTAKYFDDMVAALPLNAPTVKGIKIFGFDAEYTPDSVSKTGEIKMLITPEKAVVLDGKKFKTPKEVLAALKAEAPGQYAYLDPTQEAMLDVFLKKPASISNPFSANIGSIRVTFDPNPKKPTISVVTSHERIASFSMRDYKTTPGLFTGIRAKIRGYQSEYDSAKDDMHMSTTKLQALSSTAAVSGESGKQLFDIVRARDAIETDIKARPDAPWKKAPDEVFGIDTILKMACPLVEKMKGTLIDFKGVISDSVPTLLIAHANARYYGGGVTPQTLHALECAKDFLVGKARSDAPDDFNDWAATDYQIFSERLERLVAIPESNFHQAFLQYRNGSKSTEVFEVCEQGILTMQQAVAQHEESRSAMINAEGVEATLMAAGGGEDEPKKSTKKGKTK